MRTESAIVIHYCENGKKCMTRPFKMREVVLKCMMDMDAITSSLWRKNGQYRTNDVFVDKFLEKINKLYNPLGKLTPDNMTYEKEKSWDTIKTKVHSAYSTWTNKEEYFNWRTLTDEELGKIKVRLDYEKTPNQVYEALDHLTTTKILEKMRVKVQRLRTYKEIAGVNSIYLPHDQKYIKAVEERI